MLLFGSAPAPDGGKASIDPFGHVVDGDHIEIFENLVIPLPPPLTKFLIFLALAALIVGLLVTWVAGKMAGGEPPRGRLWNAVESLLFFVRDKIARPGVGEHDGDKYLPFLCTLFLFIFVCNLFGMFPFLPSPTAHIYVTGALSLIVFFVIHIGGVKEHGVGGYLKTFIPHIEVDNALIKYLLMIGMAFLEYLTAFIRAIILAVRLFANMLAGHTVLFMILFFIKLVADPAYQIDIAKGQDWMYWPVSLFSVVMVVALSLLELFIAGLQAFVFTFLAAIFIGLAKHPPH
ncbi:MAG TPA: F0F1 ATP synthase subunit A [Urbifossiella sp.]|jgi:F-type H+-transporting ATPase subunit a|nr:F0F1 ATP synthase subunit A [Urbifossiella sp.]